MKTQCNEESLIDLLRSENDDSLRGTAEHLEHCSHCQSRMEVLAAEPREWQVAHDILASPECIDTDDNEMIDERFRLEWTARVERSAHWTESMSKNLLSPASHPELLGRIGRYDVERLIGNGGMGVVFKAHDTELNRPVAVKLLAPYLAENGSARKRFAREARAAAAVVDEHVVAIHNVESDNDSQQPPFLVMKYIAGGSLQQRLDRDGPLHVCEILRVGMQTARGLAAAHAQGLIHRDVKPSNILLDEGVDRALLTDFGLASADDDACLTRSGFHPGTPHYMSPEQVRGEAIDGRSDLFSLGCVLYALCTGHPPFRAESSYAVLRRITDDTARPIRELNPDIPEWLEGIVLKLLSKSPEDRFDSADEVAELLEDCIAHVQHPTTSPLPECVAGSSITRAGRPPIGKFIAAAAFGFSIIFAGVLIILEMNKGTLTMESEASDVPIQILQGDDLVRELTVTKGSESVRLAAGNYRVEINDKFDGVVVKNGFVSLKRRGEETVRLQISKEQSAAYQATAEETRPRNMSAFNDSEINNPAADHPDGPIVGETVFLRMTGDVARKYAEEVGTLPDDKATPGQEIETSATVVQRLSDGRLRIEHHSPPRVVFKDHRSTLLMATVDPAVIVSEVTPRGTEIQSSPGAAIASLTGEESHSYRLTLSDLDDVVLKELIVPLPPKAAALSDLQFKRTAPALVHLLELNDDGTTHIEKLGFPTNFGGVKDVDEIHSAGKDYIAVAARRFPPEVSQPLGKDGNGIIFLFDKSGNLEAKFGGALGPDGVNAEDVQLLTLGTQDQWFAVVHISQHRAKRMTQKVFLVEDGFPLAFQISAVKSMAWTNASYEDFDFGFKHFFNPSGIPTREFGKGHDGKDYHSILGWDPQERVFRGPSQLTYKEKRLFDIRLNVSQRFRAVDRSPVRAANALLPQMKSIKRQPNSVSKAPLAAETSLSESPAINKLSPQQLYPTPRTKLNAAESSFGLNPAAQILSKLNVEFRATEAAYNKALEGTTGEAEFNRVRNELNPRAIMPSKYLAFEEEHRGTDSGLAALKVVARLASGETDPTSDAHKGLVEARRRVTLHYLDHRGLESIADLFDRLPFYVLESHGFLQTLIEKSPHRETRANALVAQIVSGKDLLVSESELPAMLEKMVIDDDDPSQFNEKLRSMRKQLENMNFEQLRADLNDKIKFLAETYSDVNVHTYGTGGVAAKRLGHAINQVVIGSEVPEIAATDINGEPFRLSKLRGKIVVLLFAEQCDDYKEMYGPLRQLVAKYDWAPVKFVGIMSNADPDNLVASSKRGDLPWTVIPQPIYGSFLRLDWGIERGCPVYIVDAEGILQPPIRMSFYGDGGYDVRTVDDKIAELVTSAAKPFFAPAASSEPERVNRPIPRQ